MIKQFYFKQFNLSEVICLRSNSSISPIDKTPSRATTLSQSGLGSNGSEGVLCIPQSSSITGTSPSDCLVSYPWRGRYPSIEMQSVYSTNLTKRASLTLCAIRSHTNNERHFLYERWRCN